MLQRRIELCSGRTSSAVAALQTAGAAAYGRPTGSGPVHAGASPKRKIPGVRGTESPDPSITDQRNRELRVRFFGGTTTAMRSLLRASLPLKTANHRSRA